MGQMHLGVFEGSLQVLHMLASAFLLGLMLLSTEIQERMNICLLSSCVM